MNSTDHNIIEKQDKLWYNNSLHNNHYGKYTTNSVEYSQSQSVQNLRQSLDPALIKQELNNKIKDLAHQFLGQPHQQKPTEWRYGNKGSISIHVAGSKQGLYSNFETGESGNALKFIQDQLECDHKQAFKWGAEWLGQDSLGTLTRTPMPKELHQIQTKQEWIPLFPAPSSIPVDLKAEQSLSYMLKGRQETARYTYKDADNNVLGYVVRLEDKHGSKITPTLTYCQNDKAGKQWRWQGFGNDRPLYGLDQLKAKPHAPVLIVEGEKTCEAARALFQDHAVVTWSGGSGAVQKTDWNVLKDREVTIWPDHDQPGLNAASKIANILKEQGNQAVKIVDVPSTLPHKWDLADRMPDGLDVREILESAVPTALMHLSQENQKEKSIVDYINSHLGGNNSLISKSTDAFLKSKLAKDPLGTLETWKVMIGDQDCFTPLSFDEMKLKAHQAEVLLENQKYNMTEAIYNSFQKTLTTDPQAVIQHCIGMAQVQLDLRREIDIKKFTDLAKEYAKMPSGSSRAENLELASHLKDIASHYQRDEKFLNAVMNNDLTKSVQKALSTNDIAENKLEENKITDVHRGFDR
jgi:5S rRNA maturation endonuclease (ribonuclease M5)